MKPRPFYYLLKKWLLAGIAFCLLTEASGQETDSLTSYLSIAAKNNPTLLQKLYEYQAALQKIPQVSALPDPQMDLGIFLSPMEIVSGKQIAEIKLMQMFPWFGVLKNAKDEKSLMAKATYESFRDTKLQVFYEIKDTWYDLYKIQQNIHLSEQSINVLKSLERLAVVRFKTAPARERSSSSGPSGAMPGKAMSTSSSVSGLSDVYQIQLEMGTLENTLSLQKNQQSTIIAKFNSYLNRPATSPVSLPDTLLPVKTDLVLSDTLFANHPMLNMLKYEQLSLEAKQKMIAQMGYPMIGFGLSYSIVNKNTMSTSSMNGQDMIMPMVSITLPIYRKKYKAMQTETHWMKSATEQGYQATANALRTDSYETIQNYLDAQRRISLYENQSNLAQKTWDILVKSFSASGSGLTDLLRIRQQIDEYEFKKTEAVTDFNKAVAKLERLNSSSVY